MSRPYICFGTTVIVSMLILCKLGFISIVAITVAALVCCVPFFIFRNKNDILNSIFICCLSLLVSSSVFITKTVTDYEPAVALVSEEKRTLCGTLCEYEEAYGKHYYTITDVRVNSTEIRQKIRVCSDIYRNAEIDDIFTFTDAVIYELGAASGNEASYKAENIYLGAYTQENFQITKAEKHSVRYYTNAVREFISAALDKNISPRYSAIINGMLTGDTSEIKNHDLMNFRYSGIAHLFAVSGFHLSLWTGILSSCLSRIFRNKHLLNNCICIIFILFFMAVTGFSKSVIRAGVMMLIFIAGKMIRHESDPLNSLFISATAIILVNPFAVMSISLQMSFLATLGILILSTPVAEPIKRLKDKISFRPLYRFILALYSTVMISVIASLFTMPVSALSFGYIAVAAPLTNLLCAFPAQLLMLLSGVYVTLSGIPFLAKPIALICTYLTKFITDTSAHIAAMNHSVMDTTAPVLQIILMAVLILMMIFIILFRESNKGLMITLFSTAATIAIVAVCAISVQSSGIRISVADVGNGTSVVLHTSDTDMIISGGGSSYRDYRLTGIADTEPSGSYDILLIPRNTETESGYTYSLLNRYSFENCIFSDDKYPAYITDFLPENTVFTDNCNIQIDTDTTLIYNNSEAFSGVRIISGKFTCTILFRPLSDFSVVPEDWAKGSLLITRQSLPDIDLSGYENIIVSSSKEVIYTNRNIYTTRYSGQIDYRMYRSGTSVITEERHDYKR